MMNYFLKFVFPVLFFSICYSQSIDFISSKEMEGGTFSANNFGFNLVEFESKYYFTREDRKKEYIDVFDEQLNLLKTIEIPGLEGDFFKVNKLFINEQGFVLLMETVITSVGRVTGVEPFILFLDNEGKFLKKMDVFTNTSKTWSLQYEQEYYRLFKDILVFINTDKQKNIEVVYFNIKNFEVKSENLSYDYKGKKSSFNQLTDFYYTEKDGLVMLFANHSFAMFGGNEPEDECFLYSPKSGLNILGNYKLYPNAFGYDLRFTLQFMESEGSLFLCTITPDDYGLMEIEYVDKNLKVSDLEAIRFQKNESNSDRLINIKNVSSNFVEVNNIVNSTNENSNASMYYGIDLIQFVKDSKSNIYHLDRKQSTGSLITTDAKIFSGSNNKLIAFYLGYAGDSKYESAKLFVPNSDDTHLFVSTLADGEVQNTAKILQNKLYGLALVHTLTQINENEYVVVTIIKEGVYKYSYKLNKITIKS